MTAPTVAQQLEAAGLGCFPCVVQYDSVRSKWQKRPRTVGGEPWQDTARRPLSDPAIPWEGVEVVGVPVPEGIVILDGDWYEEGASREAAEAVLGGPMPWDEALIQTTIGGGEHYAFRVPDWPVRQGANFGGSNVDTRTGGKGFICTGQGYTPSTFGVMRLGYPAALPVLPDHCRPLLEAVTTAPAPSTAAPQLLEEALAYIPPDTDRDTWLRCAMAIRHHFEAAPEAGFELFDRWSYGGLCDEGCPASYVPEHNAAQYWALKPAREGATTATAGTVFFKAVENGWIPPASFDTSTAFGGDAASPDVFNALVTRINESGTDIAQTEATIAAIKGGRCNALQRDLLTLLLKAALREAKVLDKTLSARLDGMLRPDTVPHLAPPPLSLPDVVDIEDLPATALGRPSGLHGVNALLMRSEIFGGRVATLHGVMRWWSGREWQAIPDDTLSRITYNALMPDQCKTPNVAGTRAALKVLADPLGDSARGPLIFFKDCVLNAQTGEVTAHSPEYCNTSSLQVSRTESAHAPEWFAFLERIFGGSVDGDDRKALLQEILGWAILQDDLNVQKVAAFDGASRAGKGVILEVLQAIMGTEKSGVITFANIDDGKTQSAFRRHDVVMDLEAKPPANQSLKTAIGFMNKVASNEAVSIQLLNTQQPWTGRLHCKMLIACNGIPALLDDSGATTNRFLVLFFTRSFTGAAEDKGLLGRLLLEKDAIAAWATQGAHRLANNGGTFTTPATSIDAMSDMKETNQPLSEFIDQYMVFSNEGRTSAGDIWAAYRIYASECNIRLGTKNAFGRSLRRALLEHPCDYQRSMRIDGKVSSGYVGVAVRELVSGTTLSFAPQAGRG